MGCVEEAIKQAISLGPSAELVLVECANEAKKYKTLLSPPRWATCPPPRADDQLLRELVVRTGPGTADIRCASAEALAKSVGGQGTGDYLLALGGANSAVKDYALNCLAAFGDESGWEPVFGYLPRWLRRSYSTIYGGPSPTVTAVDYLIRHANALDRWERVAQLRQQRWARLSEDDRQEGSAWTSCTPPDQISDAPLYVTSDQVVALSQQPYRTPRSCGCR